MFRKVEDFLRVWKQNEETTLRILNALTDESLGQEVTPQGRTLGRIAWHMVQSIPYMMSRAGLDFPSPAEDAPVPQSAQKITEQFQQVSNALSEELKAQWTDESLTVVNNFFGLEFPNGVSLLVLLQHQVHHLGQISVLMRQAGLTVPGIIGPAKEEWANIGMEAPE